MIATENESAVSNLLAAYEGELNAYARYKAYASRAEAEGMNGAASLFRAAKWVARPQPIFFPFP